jgi:transposase
MFQVGIDVSKYKHDCYIITDDGEVIRESFTFDNTRQGFNYFLEIINELDKSQEIRIGLESTGHYGNNLKNFLIDNGLEFCEYNPFIIKKVTEALTLRKSKTDKVDAKFIAYSIQFLDYKTYSKSYHMYSLKSLTRYRSNLIKRRSYLLVELTNILDNIFPEFKSFFNNKFSKTALYLLKNYSTPERMTRITKTAGYEKLRIISRGRFTFINYLQLIDLAKNTIGSSHEFFVIQIKSVLRQFELINQEIDEIDSKIIESFGKINHSISSIPGIGIISAATIIAEFGDLDLFDNPKQLLAFAGLDPSINQSGTHEGNSKMVKRGSPYLRNALMMSSMTVIRHNHVFAEYYHKKRKEGKLHNAAKSHVVRKLLRVIFHLHSNNMLFDVSLCK